LALDSAESGRDHGGSRWRPTWFRCAVSVCATQRGRPMGYRHSSGDPHAKDRAFRLGRGRFVHRRQCFRPGRRRGVPGWFGLGPETRLRRSTRRTRGRTTGTAMAGAGIAMAIGLRIGMTAIRTTRAIT